LVSDSLHAATVLSWPIVSFPMLGSMGILHWILIHQIFHNRSVKVWARYEGLFHPCSLPLAVWKRKDKFYIPNFFSEKTKKNKQLDIYTSYLQLSIDRFIISNNSRVLRAGWLKKFERIRINLSHLGLVPGLCQGSRAFPVLEPCHQAWHQPCFPI
jgi:hypothetical protein